MQMFLIGLVCGYTLYFVIDTIASYLIDKYKDDEIDYSNRYVEAYKEYEEEVKHKEVLDKPEIIKDYDFLPYGKDDREVCK